MFLKKSKKVGGGGSSKAFFPKTQFFQAFHLCNLPLFRPCPISHLHFVPLAQIISCISSPCHSSRGTNFLCLIFLPAESTNADFCNCVQPGVQSVWTLMLGGFHLVRFPNPLYEVGWGNEALQRGYFFFRGSWHFQYAS